MDRDELRSIGAAPGALVLHSRVMQDYRHLMVWEKAHAFALDVHRVSSRFPRRNGAVLANQLQRASLSVPSNIVEGAGKSSDKEFRRFLVIAMTSANEADYHLLVARDSGLMGRVTYDDLTSRLLEVRRMLGGFIKRLTLSIDNGSPDDRPPNRPPANTTSSDEKSPEEARVDGSPPERRTSFVPNAPVETKDIRHTE